MEGYSPSEHDRADHDIDKSSSDPFLDDFKDKCQTHPNCHYYATSETGVATYKKGNNETHFCQSKGGLVILKGNSKYFDERCVADFPNNPDACSLADTWIPSLEYTQVANLTECSDRCPDNGFYSWNEDWKKCGILNQKDEDNNATFCTLSGYTTFSKACETSNCKKITGM